jgi:hydrogenase maturation protein HypF
VGFRPHVHALATRLGLNGFVLNETGAVLIEVEGRKTAVERFAAALIEDPPPLARIDGFEAVTQAPRGQTGFRIEDSRETAEGPVALSPDIATCSLCLGELFDPRDRRHLYPFINCTHCGPRLTIIRAAPYDRDRTTMAGFQMCALCLAEYEDPASRRFHAQPNACPTCGPRLELLDAMGERMVTPDPLASALEALWGGRILALKSLGGYHLVCDATSAAAVARLRERKHRHEKPLALLVKDAPVAEALCEVSPSERVLLISRERPIVLLRRRAGSPVASTVSPGNPLLGVMLPYTPLHYLLARGMQGFPLVMTSGNRSDEPIAFEDRDAVERLRGIADFFLVHDRPIHVRCDDSVARVFGASPALLRRSRGYAPAPLALPISCAGPMLALGGHLKATFAFGQGERALLGPHIGDLDDHRTYRSYVETIERHQDLLRIDPVLLVHDLHPDYGSTAYARERAAADGLPCLAVQHHHAHMASCLAEHGLTGPAIGVTFDGSGYGTDGTLWGGEFLVGDCRSFRRAAHLRPVPLPGGERAIREPWRAALSHLLDAQAPAGIERLLAPRIAADVIRTVTQMVERRVNAPVSSSMGRIFDVAAALTGVRDRSSFEGQAAMDVEWLAEGAQSAGTYPFDIQSGAEALVVDTRPLVRSIASDSQQGVSATIVARRLHDTILELIVSVCAGLRAVSGINVTVLSGGVFQNALLSQGASEQLSSAGFQVYRHQRVPPNDGGLAFGQLAVAAATTSRVSSQDLG